MLQTYHRGGQPAFVETLDAIAVGQAAKLPLVMIYGDDTSHVVTEEGVAYLYQAGSLEERRDALAAVAKATPIGTRITPRQAERLRRAGLVAYPADLGVDPTLADRSLLAARSIEDLVTWSQGLYRPARPVPGLVVTAAAERAKLPRGSGRRALALDPYALGRLAAGALRAEAELTPKPG